jgi:hypothetical protein
MGGTTKTKFLSLLEVHFRKFFHHYMTQCLVYNLKLISLFYVKKWANMFVSTRSPKRNIYSHLFHMGKWIISLVLSVCKFYGIETPLKHKEQNNQKRYVEISFNRAK